MRILKRVSILIAIMFFVAFAAISCGGGAREILNSSDDFYLYVVNDSDIDVKVYRYGKSDGNWEILGDLAKHSSDTFRPSKEGNYCTYDFKAEGSGGFWTGRLNTCGGAKWTLEL